MIKRIVLITLVVVSNLQSMEIIKPVNIFVQMLPNNNRVSIPQEFAAQSAHLTLLQEGFNNKGTKINPFEVILNPSIGANTFKKFIAGALTQDIIEQAKFIWIAHYLAMPVLQHQYEYDLRKKLKKLGPKKEIPYAQHLGALDLLLPTSFYHTLLARRLTKLFVATYPLALHDQPLKKIREDKQTEDKLFESRMALIEKEYGLWRENTKYYLSTSETILVLSAVCSEKSYLVYVAETMEQPVQFDYPDDTEILFYTLSPQDNKIVSWDSNKTLIVWDRIKNTADIEINNWQKTIIDNNIQGYKDIFFSQDGILFITLEKTPAQTITIKVWESHTNQIIACYASKHQHISLIEFFMNNTQLLLHTSEGEFEVFSLQKQSIIQKGYNETLNDRHYKNCCLIKSKQEKYYLTRSSCLPRLLYDHYHNYLIKLCPVTFCLNWNDHFKSPHFDSVDDAILLTTSGWSRPAQTFKFNIQALDAILEEINKLTPSQAVALFFVSKILHAKRKENKLKEKNHSSEINHTIKKPLSIRHQKTIEFLKKELSRLTGPLKDLLDAA